MPQPMLTIDWKSAGTLAPALREIVADYPGRFAEAGGFLVAFAPGEGGDEGAFSIATRADGAVIAASEPSIALRALGHLMAQAAHGQPFADRREATPFPARGVMIDASRNAVPTVATVKLYLRRMALMGLNRFLLYCEDTYEIPSEPFFGYFRGRYSQAELREIDDTAFALGIEVVLCIQTLGHLEKMLQWPRFAECRDTAGVLIAETPAVYELVGKMLDAAACLRSRRIHIGMDEAHGVGSGQYRSKFGLKPPFDILLGHLQKVVELCRARGLEPMIWSDMFFRLGSKTDAYYDFDAVIPPHVPAQIPAGVGIVYWDYYHVDRATYDVFIGKHFDLGSAPILATGVWSWNRFWTTLPYTVATTGPALDSARAHGLKDVFTTIWGDNGGEVDLISTLMGVQYFAEKCFGNGEAEADFHFEAIVDPEWTSWVAASELDRPDPAQEWAGNDSKFLLWTDPLLGFLDKEMPPGNDRFAPLARALDAKEGNFHLELPRRLAHVLALKGALHRDLRPAYRARDLKRLEEIVGREIPALVEAVRALHRAHHTLWMKLYKPFGWEVLDLRYGGLLARLETTRETVARFLADPARPVAELDAEPLALGSKEDFHPGFLRTYAQVTSPSSA